MAEEREGSTGRGLGVGEVKVDAAGEGDGCDRCGCPDEEKCCQGFWNDAGVPPIWPLSWIMDPKNKYLNDNKCARIFGNIGFGWFDKERKAFMGTALALTVVAIVITGFGCFALSDDDSIIFYTTWGISYMKYTNADGVKVGQIAYLGLRKFLRYECLDTSSGSNWREWADCTEDNVWWSAVECGSGGTLYYGYRCDEVEHCSEAAQASQFGAFMTAATLVFAMLGCLTRIRKVADTNWQKVLGCIPDTLGVITQAQALWLFADGCYSTFPDENEEGHKITYLGGPGYWAYVFCWLAAIVRVTMHYMTPVPGGGAGCRLVDLKKGFVELEKDAEAAAKEVGRSMSKTKDPVSKQPDPELPKNSGLT